MNLYKICANQGIPDPWGLPLDDVQIELFLNAQKWKNSMRKRYNWGKIISKHAWKKAKDRNEDGKVGVIKDILQNEANKSW